MAVNNGLAGWWQEYRPSKALWLWSSAGTAVLTILVGFTWGGWKTGEAARQMATESANAARAQLVADACVDKFKNSDDFAAQLAALKEASSWKRSDLLAASGWVTLAGMEKPLGDAAKICAERLLADNVAPKANRVDAADS